MSEVVEPESSPAGSSPAEPRALSMSGERLPDFDFSKVVPYNFRNPEFLSVTDMRQLTALNASFGLHLSARLSTFLRMECGLKTVEFANMPFARFAESITTPSHVSLFQIEPLRGVGIMEMSIPLGLAMADRLLGGKGRVTAPERSLTEIETALLDDVVGVMLHEWTRSWEGGSGPLTGRCIGHETGGAFLHTSPADGVMLVSTLDATLGELTGRMQLGIPFSMIEPMLKSIQPTEPTGAEAPSKKIQWRTAYSGISVPIEAEWKLRDMTLGDVMRMTEGQVIELPRDLISETWIRFANTEEFVGTAGLKNGQVAVQLTRRIVKD